jgi:hypothetical protein
MANCFWPSDDFLGAGQSAAWGMDGELLVQMDSDSAGILMLDLKSGKSVIHKLREIICAANEASTGQAGKRGEK